MKKPQKFLSKLLGSPHSRGVALYTQKNLENSRQHIIFVVENILN